MNRKTREELDRIVGKVRAKRDYEVIDDFIETCLQGSNSIHDSISLDIMLAAFRLYALSRGADMVTKPKMLVVMIYERLSDPNGKESKPTFLFLKIIYSNLGG